jgi:hypothetical protein
VTDTESRTEILARQAGDRLPRRWTFPLFLVPAILVVLLADVASVVALASRVFAAYYLLQAGDRRAGSPGARGDGAASPSSPASGWRWPL